MPEGGRSEPEQFRKIFIGGLSIESTEESLKGHFEQWGEIVDCVVMRDANTKRSRGFGFITYKYSSSVDESQKHRPHVLDDKEVETKRATPREDSGKPDSHVTIKKLFIGGMSKNATEDDVREHFSEYGNIESIDVIKDKDTGAPRGFGFVTFDDYDAVDKCVLRKNHVICGKKCDVKKAVPKDGSDGRGGGRGDRGGRGGRGGGRGGGRNFGGGDRYGGGGNFGNNFSNDNFGGGYNNQGGGFDNYGNGGNQGGAWGNDFNQGGGNWGGNQGGGGGNYGNGNYGGGNYGGGNYGGGNYGGGNQGGGGGAMRQNFGNRGQGPYGGGYGSGGGGGYNRR